MSQLTRSILTVAAIPVVTHGHYDVMNTSNSLPAKLAAVAHQLAPGLQPCVRSPEGLRHILF
jgi:hypothetical protein